MTNRLQNPRADDNLEDNSGGREEDPTTGGRPQNNPDRNPLKPPAAPNNNDDQASSTCQTHNTDETAPIQPDLTLQSGPRRSGRIRKRPDYLMDFDTYMVDTEPATFREAAKYIEANTLLTSVSDNPSCLDVQLQVPAKEQSAKWTPAMICKPAEQTKVSKEHRDVTTHAAALKDQEEAAISESLDARHFSSNHNNLLMTINSPLVYMIWWDDYTQSPELENCP
ncbi:hypothetical protein R1sor_025127 [Riccia sorocarpa]|uniref:Uncharacterized protein n=1 Tax=Riccia sorocarpa TaxID=122646 RepID=A0ABD3G9Q0_9MARC